MKPATTRCLDRGRLAGVCYLAVFVCGYVYLALIPNIGLQGNNVEKAVPHIVAHPAAFWVGYVSLLLSIALRLVLMILFYDLFRPVNERASRLAVYFNVLATSVQAVGAVFLVVPLAVLAGSHHYLASFSPGQLHDLAAMALRLNYYAYAIALAFFGGYDLLIGLLAWKSGFVPRPIGTLMILTGLAWLTYVLPDAAPRLVPFNLIVGSLGEIAMIVWLLVRGVSDEQWLRSPNRVIVGAAN